MKYTVVSSAEYTYPDRFEYMSSSASADVCGVRGGYAAFQIVLRDVTSEELSVRCEGFDAEIYVLYPIPVERNIGFNRHNVSPHMPERIAPFTVYDALMPYRGRVVITDGTAGLYCAIPLARDAAPGITEGAVIIGDCRVPVKVETMAAQLPPETLKVVQGYSRNFEEYHGIAPGTPAYEAMEDAYIAAMRRMHQNTVYVGDWSWKKVGDYQWEFDFSGTERFIERAMAQGMKYFICHSIGCRHSWWESTIYIKGDIPAMSYEGYCYLSQFLPALHEMLERRGWLDIFMIDVSDEPNDYNATEFRALCGTIRRFVPDLKLIDAMSYGDLHGALDICVPLVSEYARFGDKIENMRLSGGEVWDYVCLYPRGQGYLNRHMDYPLLCTRLLLWANYKYHLEGYLHWAVNWYMSGIAQDSGTPYRQDPFVCSCPEHHNADAVSFLPAGDTHLVYPGGYHGHGDVQEPWLSMRAEAQRESAEEYEMLRALAARDPARADAICRSVFRAFNDIDFDVPHFEEVRRELLRALSEE